MFRHTLVSKAAAARFIRMLIVFFGKRKKEKGEGDSLLVEKEDERLNGLESFYLLFSSVALFNVFLSFSFSPSRYLPRGPPVFRKEQFLFTLSTHAANESVRPRRRVMK